MAESTERNRLPNVAWRLWGPRLPVIAAAAFVVALLWRLPRLVEAISWNADALAPALIAERAVGLDGVSANSGATVLGDISSASTLWFHLLTVDLPGHRLLWAYWPALLALATALLVGWCCLRLAGRWAGALGAALVLAAGPDALLTFLAPAFRGPTWLSSALLAAFLVHLGLSGARPLGPRVVLAFAVALIVGVNLASDPLLALAGVLPLVGAPALTWYVARTAAARRVALVALGTAITAGLVALGALVALHAGGFVTRRERFGSGYTQLADPAAALDHLPLVGRGLLALLGAPNMGGQIVGHSPVRWAIALLLLGALAFALVPIGTRRATAAEPTPELWLARRTYLTYWALAAIAVTVGFVLSDIPADAAVTSVPGTRYLIPLALGAVAVLPLFAQAPPGAVAPLRRAAAGAAAGLIVVGAGLALAGGDLEHAQRGELPAQGARIAGWLADQGVDRGYAGYWSAGPLSYHTGLRVLAVRPCLTGRGETLCPVALNGRRDWYRPAAGFSSFVLLDATRPGDAITPGAWRRAFGAPAESRRFGTLIVRVYPYDLAERFTPGWRPYPDERLAARADGRLIQPVGGESSSSTAHTPSVN